MMTTSQVAKKLGISTQTIYRMMKDKGKNNFPEPKILFKRSWRWRREDIEKFISDR